MLADLHMHTTASDGQYDPAQVAGMARELGLEVIAITDHDTIDGVEEAVAAGARMGPRVLRGIELSGEEYPNLHILGLGFPAETPKLRRMCEELRQRRERRKYRIRDFLRDRGLEVPLDEVEKAAAGGIIGRPHFARVMLDRGLVSTREEAFGRYLDIPEFHALEKGTKPTARECVEIIKASGGMASLAHPYQVGLGDEGLEELVSRLKDWGLDAIECCYTKHTPERTEFYLSLARRFGLRVTGGSDFLGDGEQFKPDYPMAKFELDLDWLNISPG